eukprot:jgi/Botrbrau1/20072/Bobra.200_1s0076.1
MNANNDCGHEMSPKSVRWRLRCGVGKWPYLGLVCMVRMYTEYDTYSYTEVASHTNERACMGDEDRPPYTVVILSSSFSNQVPNSSLEVRAKVPKFCKSWMILIFFNLRQMFSS